MNLKALPTLILKDLKVFFRSPIAAAAIIIAPLLIILFAGTSFDSSSMDGIKISTYSDNYTEINNQIISSLENENYIIKKLKTEEKCTESVKLAQSQICIIFSKENENSENITFHVDYSRINLVHTLIHKIEEHIDITSSEIGTLLIQNVLDSVNSIKNNLPEEKEKIDSTNQELDTIKQELTNINLQEEKINSAITSLNAALTTANDSTTESKITESINLLTEITTNITTQESQINDIKITTDEIQSNLNTISQNLNEVLEELENKQTLEAKSIASPITISIESIKKDSNNSEYLIPTIITLIALFTGILLSATLIIKEKKTKAYFRNFMTPTKDMTFIFGTYLSCMIIFAIQFLLIFMGIKIFLDLNLSFSILGLSLILFLGLTIFILIGMLLGYLFKSEETAIFGAVFVSAILMFFSNSILPIESIMGGVKSIILYNPVILVDVALKKILLFDLAFSNLKFEIFSLLIIAAILLIFTFLARKITKTKL